MKPVCKFSGLPLKDTSDDHFIEVNFPFSSVANAGWTLKCICDNCCNEIIWSWDEKLNNQIHQDRFVRLPSLFAKKWNRGSFLELSRQIPHSYIGEFNKLEVILDDCDGGMFHIGMNKCTSCDSVLLLQYRKGYPPEEREQNDKKDIAIEFKSIFSPDQNFIPSLYQAVIKPLPESWTKTKKTPPNL